MRERLAVAGLLLVSLAVGLVVAEVVLRIALPSPDGYYVYPPGLDRSFQPDEELMPGVHGVSHFRVSADGLRASERDADDALRLLAVGGSTTQCLYLDQWEAWPGLLQERLGEATGRPVWVGNAGKAGRRLAEHILQVEMLARQLPDLDGIILLVGANDVNQRLAADHDVPPFDPEDEAQRHELLGRAFDLFPRSYDWFPPGRTALAALRDRVQQTLRIRRAWRQRQDHTGENYQAWREMRASASRIRTELPDLDGALGTYRTELETIRRIARRAGIPVLFVTQPAIYRPDLPPELERLLWMGWVGVRGSEDGDEYYSVAAMARAYDLYNDALRRFCREREADCLDLAPLLPKDTRSFYDDLHFNEAGADRVAEAIREHLRATWLRDIPSLRSGGSPPTGADAGAAHS